MNRSFSTFTKRFLLAASIGLVAIQSPTAIFADDENEPQPNVVVQKGEATATASSSEGGTITTHSSSTTDENGKQQNRLIFVQSGSPVPHTLPLPPNYKPGDALPAGFNPPPGFKHVIESSEANGQPVYTVRFIDESGNARFSTHGSAPILPSAMIERNPYWIGAELRPLNETMRWMLKLPEGRGIAVFKIMPESSAAKAGLKERDILIKADEKVLAVPAQLMEILAKSEGKELKIVYIRDLEGQKEITTTIKPDKRPESKEPGTKLGSAEKGTYTIGKMYGAGVNSNAGIVGDIVTFSPQGFAVPPQMHAQMLQAHAQSTTLPDGLSISITRVGDKPAEIKVKRGDESWEVTDKELDKLPEDIRKHVQGSFSLGWQGAGQRFFMNAQPATMGGTVSGGVITQAAPFTPGQPFTMPLSPPNAEAIQKQAEAHHKKVQEEIAKAQAAQQAAMQKQMEQLQKQVEAIQKQMEKK